MKKMTKEKGFVLAILLFSFALILNFGIKVYSSRKNDDLKIFKTNIGWAYEIQINRKTFIRQEYIPAINGKQAFKTKVDAEKAGNLVMYKIKNGLPPNVSISELDSLAIKY
jgi:hypothetical protein